ncbi:MAG: hypothetical protein HEQ21_11610 [Blastomonas sp.]|jgi:hypothetical protein|uniref:hypothetical protein n=1 Tax=Blastomonas TaxID=150203 RepID=UPI0006B8B593|nr:MULTISPECIES: hypothetical protein [Blastomonas]AOG02361.1 putative membrane protein [Blastomonas sp. RAC04]KPF74611.1 hypothetical protein IP68_12730 [Blastomonas sp. AAP25]MCO5793459.1 hypothetical protein [Blastomonas sp.]MDK2757421.1 hypothetical protein [Blastomonas fulva]
MFDTLQSTLVVAGLFGLMAAPFVGVMLILLAIGASSGLIIGLGFLALLASGTFAVSQRGQTFLSNGLRKATRR